VAVGSTDRWFRLRRGSDGALLYSLLEPPHSHGVSQIIYSTDGELVGVRNSAFGLSFRVQRASDGGFVGTVVATVGSNGLVTFSPDATLLANTGGDGTISRWRFSDLSVFQTTGSGYEQVTTTFNFSPDGLLQTAAKQGQVVVQRRSDGAVVRVLRGGSLVVFSPASDLVAIWSAAPSRVVVWRVTDWAVVHRIALPNPLEGIGGLRFTLDGQRLVSTGYSPFIDASGLWQQNGVIRFIDVASGSILLTYDQETDIGVTSPVAWSSDGSRFAYGLQNGTVAVATTPP
jgi:WD40 repeat protein